MFGFFILCLSFHARFVSEVFRFIRLLKAQKTESTRRSCSYYLIVCVFSRSPGHVNRFFLEHEFLSCSSRNEAFRFGKNSEGSRRRSEDHDQETGQRDASAEEAHSLSRGYIDLTAAKKYEYVELRFLSAAVFIDAVVQENYAWFTFALHNSYIIPVQYCIVS